MTLTSQPIAPVLLHALDHGPWLEVQAGVRSALQAHQLAQTVAVFRIADSKEAPRLAKPQLRIQREPASAKTSERPRAAKAQVPQISLDDEWEEF